MPIHKLKLISTQEVATDTIVFSFEKPKGFNFIPGQYGGFTHVNPIDKDPSGLTRRFSLLSTPDDDTILIVTRMQNSVYKNNLKALVPGNEMKFAGPTGNFVLHDDINIPAVMIAGGIGISPFYSMIRHALAHQSSRKITLLYGNQSLQDAAFVKELESLQKQNRNFSCIITLTNPDSGWKGETGFISYDMIKRHVPELTQSIFYVCGSPAMVNALREILDDLEIPAGHIRVEDFPGY